MLTITKNNFESEVMKSEKPVLLDFWAIWCAPCKMLIPILEEVAEEVDYVKIGKVNVDEEPELAAAFGARSVPLLAVVKDGEVVEQSLGLIPKEAVLKLIEPYNIGREAAE